MWNKDKSMCRAILRIYHISWNKDITSSLQATLSCESFFAEQAFESLAKDLQPTSSFQGWTFGVLILSIIVCAV